MLCTFKHSEFLQIGVHNAPLNKMLLSMNLNLRREDDFALGQDYSQTSPCLIEGEVPRSHRTKTPIPPDLESVAVLNFSENPGLA